MVHTFARCRTMFNSINPDEKRVNLDDSSVEVACLVNHIYGGDKFTVDHDNLVHCSRMAHKYDMPRLQNAVAAFVQQVRLSDANVAQCMVVAYDNPDMHM